MSGIGLGLVCGVGEVEGERIPLLRHIIRMNKKEPSEKKLKHKSLKWVAHHRSKTEVLIVDAGVEISDLQEAGVTAYVVRVARNITARRNELPEYKGRGARPRWGNSVRPLARLYKEKLIEATVPDRTETFVVAGRQVVAHSWLSVVRSDQRPCATNPTYAIWVFHDPLYQNPLSVATDLQHLQAATVYHLYENRWPVEQIPLVGKQLLGLHRQFVFADESCQRLPELAFCWPIS